jgi:hypothetical protein
MGFSFLAKVEFKDLGMEGPSMIIGDSTALTSEINQTPTKEANRMVRTGILRNNNCDNLYI